MVITLYNFSKKRNSTTVPSGSGDSTFTGTLRDGCTVLNPVISFAINRQASPTIYTYARIPQWHRYYYIQDWKWENGLWTAYMEVDAMGSYKNEIGRSECYVLRAYYEKDANIIDSLYPTTITEQILTTISDSAYFKKEFEEGTYILGVIGEGNTDGAVNYYVMTPSQMRTFRTAILSNVQSLVGTTEITSELLKALFNPFQYVVSAIWLPIGAQYLPTDSTENIMLGWWDSGATGATLSSYVWKDIYDFTFNIGLPTVQEKYMLSAPYSAYSLFFPPFGSIELDSSILVSNYDPETVGYPVECHADVVVDLITGMGFIQIQSYGNVLGYKEALVGVPTQLGQSTQDVLSGVQNVIGGIGNIASGVQGIFSGIGGISQITSGINGIIDAGKSVVPTVQTSGSNGGLGALQFHPYLQIVRKNTVDRNPQENGYPLCKTKTINTLSGYIKTLNADIVIADATDFEQEQIRTTMNGGFFYE